MPPWLRRCFAPIFLFALNLAICGRLLHTEYLNQMGSIEGSFIAMATYIQHHWPGYEWFPLCWTGLPFQRLYQPGLHYSVAALATVSGLSAASAYHALTAATYSLGPVAFYFLARRTGATQSVAFFSALVFSVFSPSVLLAKEVRLDLGGMFYARRLQDLVHYGEGPNITGLTLAMLALAALHAAVEKRTALSGALASLAIVAVAITNWPSTVALAMGIAAWVAAQDVASLRKNLLRVVVISAGACAVAMPFALPSTVAFTVRELSVIDDPPTEGITRWIAVALLLVALIAVRAVLLKRNVAGGLRFASLYLVLTGGIVLTAYHLKIRVISQPRRFHLAVEIAFVLTAGLLAQSFLQRRRAYRAPLAILLILFCGVQAYRYRQYADHIIQPIDITQKVEYQEARWLEANAKGTRVMVPGSTALWMNIFTETPQMSGFFDQSRTPENLLAANLIANGYRDDNLTAADSLLWLKAFAVGAFGIGGAQSREYYHQFHFPNRFKGRLPIIWSPDSANTAGDVIYRVPERSSSLARVVHDADLIRNHPADGLDVGELRTFVAALDNPAFPLATFEWENSNQAKIEGVLAQDQVLEVAINYERGWTATTNGMPVPVRADGLGFIAIHPQCNGACNIRLRWSPGREPLLAWCAALGALVVGGVLIWRERNHTLARAANH